MVRLLQAQYDSANNKGELLMKLQLDLRVRDEMYFDNTRPAILTQPSTGHRLEYDRQYLLSGVAFEYNGFYHHAKNDAAPADQIEAAKETQTRDIIKEGLSAKARITLVTITAEDLQFDTFAELIPDILPRRWLDRDGLYCRELARLSNGYASYAAKAGQQVAGSR